MTMGGRTTHSIACHPAQLSLLSLLLVQLCWGGDGNPSARLAGASGVCSPITTMGKRLFHINTLWLLLSFCLVGLLGFF